MRRLRNGLVLLLVAVVVVRLVAWLVTPGLIALIVVLTVLVMIMVKMLGGPRHLS